jgi:CheY-like chemotaxis protein
MSSSEQPSQRASGLRVLVVEDEIMVALLLEEVLADFGHAVIGPIARLDKAVETAGREAIDAAILDVNLNGSEIYPVADVLAARNIPFAFCSGYGRQTLRAPYGDRPILQKPFRREQLQEVLTALSRARRD